MRVLALALVLSACSSAAEPAAPPAEVPTVAPLEVAEGAASPSRSEVIPVPSVSPTEPRPTRETNRAVALAVREGRRAAHEGRLSDALAHFDRALELVPGQARVLCEAGYVAHRAGDEATAARRIDLALFSFGPPEHASPRMREPLAMCLYNRGLVAEASGDHERAARAYEASLALRSNATVRAALARAASTTPATDDADDDAVLLGTASFVDDVIRVESPEALLAALAVGMRGFADDEETPVAAATVRLRETLHRPSDGGDIVLVDVDSGDAHYPVQHLVVAERVATGYRVGAVEVGRQDLMVSETDGDLSLLNVSSRWEGDVLVVSLLTQTSYGSYDTSEEDGAYCTTEVRRMVTETTAVLCAPAGCVQAAVGLSDSGESVYRQCEVIPEDEEEVAEPTITEEPGEPESSEVRFRIEGNDIVVEAEGETTDDLLSVGRHPLDELDPLPTPEWTAE